MTRNIKITPRELIKHLEWTPGTETPKPTPPRKTPPVIAPTSRFSIADLVNHGNPFYNTDKDENNNSIGVAVSLQQALEYATAGGVVASMPYLIAGKAAANNDNYLWKTWLTALTEEDAGIDRKGKLVGRGKEVVLTVHGGGILTPQRIRRAYTEGLTPQKAAKFTEDEFDNLLEGILPDGERISLYTVDDIKKGISDPFGRYAVWTSAETAKSKPSNYHAKADFMNNELVIARAGTLEHLDKYFESAKHPSTSNVGNWHRFGEIDYHQAQGRVLFLNTNYYGLFGGSNLGNVGRFVGVAPEAPGGR